ncbi:TPA: hypothetical protein ACH3X3_007142 [Trebouxia sp. C0006]
MSNQKGVQNPHFANTSFCREDFARALSKPNSIAVSLTVSSHCDGVTVFNESPLLPIVQGYLSRTLPGSFQKTSQAILSLQQMNRMSHLLSKYISVTAVLEGCSQRAHITGDCSGPKQVSWSQIAASIGVMSNHLVHRPIPSNKESMP